MTQYQSEQVQAGGTAFTGGASFHAGYNAAKLNTAQVEQQTGIHVGKGGMEVKVGGQYPPWRCGYRQ